MYDPAVHDRPGFVSCYDPATMALLAAPGTVPDMSPAEVASAVSKSRAAQREWRASGWPQRRLWLRVLSQYIRGHQRDICRVSSRDSGKPAVDAAFGEVLVTLEKIAWLLAEGERWLAPERRSAGSLVFYKGAQVEYHPLGVVGCIVPFNYPFHNILNPVLAAVFSGNGCVVKVSEHASWSSGLYGRILTESLAAVGAPTDLVQIVTGGAETGRALVEGEIDKMVFVGSTGVGRHVMKSCAARLTPVVLELGGKDPFIVLEDAEYDRALSIGLRGAFQSGGQNCTGAERFIVHRSLYARWTEDAAAAVAAMRQGPPLGAGRVDVGALCLPGLAERVQELVDDAVAHGGRVLAGGTLPRRGSLAVGQFYPPTVLCLDGGLRQLAACRAWREETFGPVMICVPFDTDEEAIALANDCPFGLGSSVFSRDASRCRAVGSQMDAGMTALDDFASGYMCQSLPFGGVKLSGFDRFAGVEGLRGMCVPKAVSWDLLPSLMTTALPPPLRYPTSPQGFAFVESLCRLFYGTSVAERVGGVWGMARASMAVSS